MKKATNTSVSVFDPFGYSIELPFEANVSAMGFPLRLLTNSPDILAVTEELWTGYPFLFHDKSLELRVVVSDNESAKCPTGIVWRAQKHLMTVTSDQDNFAVCDLDRAFGSFWLAPATARNHEFFRRYYLENVLQLMLWHSHLTSVHAACVVRNGRGVLLCGESGAGKTCLSYACARRGWEFVTDDSPSLVRGSNPPMVVGGPRHMHFRPTAAAILPELNGRLSRVNLNGKVSIEVRADEFPEITRTAQAQVNAVVFLNRQAGGEAGLCPIPASEAFSRLERELPLMEDYENQKASLRALVAVGAFDLRYQDLDGAVKLLESLVQ